MFECGDCWQCPCVCSKLDAAGHLEVLKNRYKSSSVRIGKAIEFFIPEIEKSIKDKEEKDYIPAPNCTSPGNEHFLENAEPPFFAKCTYCGIKFYLVSKATINKLNVEVIPRPTTEM